MNPIPAIMHTLAFVKARCFEASTWVAIGATVAAVSTLAAPWSYVGLGCGIMAAMVPNQKKPDA